MMCVLPRLQSLKWIGSRINRPGHWLCVASGFCFPVLRVRICLVDWHGGGGGRGKRDEINKQTEPKRRETKAARVPHAMIDDVCRPTNGGRIASALRLILSAEYATTADGRSISHLCLLRVGALHIFCFGPSWGGGVVLISSHS